jgi:hypothetical protein
MIDSIGSYTPAAASKVYSSNTRNTSTVETDFENELKLRRSLKAIEDYVAAGKSYKEDLAARGISEGAVRKERFIEDQEELYSIGKELEKKVAGHPRASELNQKYNLSHTWALPKEKLPTMAGSNNGADKNQVQGAGAGKAPEAEAVNEAQRPEEAKEKRSRLIEVSLRDPWASDDPRRAECDRFLKIFEDTYHEVLAEMGLAPESGDYASIVMTRKNLGEIQRRMVEKLNANPEARELMAVLNVDFSGEAEAASGQAGRRAERPAWGGGHHAARLDEARNFFFEEWRKKHREEVPADQKASEAGLEDLARPRRQTTRVL